MRHVRTFTATIGALLIGTLGAVLHADAQDDLSHARGEVDGLRSRMDTARASVTKYLDQSTALRALDDSELKTLIAQICRLDIEASDDEPWRVASKLKDDAVARVRAGYDDTIREASREKDDLDRFEADVRSTIDRVRSLQDKDETKDEASKLHDELDHMIEALDKLEDSIEKDRRSLDRVQAGTMSGSNNPTIRAKMEYGKEMHLRLQSSRSCDEKEVVLSSGRPDCIKFDQDACKVIEFKPDSYSEGDARDQAARYINDVRARFKDDERAKRCVQTADGPKFEPVGELYERCTPI